MQNFLGYEDIIIGTLKRTNDFIKERPQSRNQNFCNGFVKNITKADGSKLNSLIFSGLSHLGIRATKVLLTSGGTIVVMIRIFK